jgi:hypothetical protein
MNEHERNLAALFEGMDEVTVREYLIAAVRKVRANPVNRPSTEKLHLTTIQRELLPMLRARDNAPNVPESPCGFLSDYLGWDHPWALPVVSFLSWLERTGLVFLPGRGGADDYVRQMRLLPAGREFFDRPSDGHPLMPGWIERIKARCPGLGDDVLAIMSDAQTCHAHELLRASVVLLGVAFETVVGSVHESMEAKNLPLTPPKPRLAAERIASVRSGINLRIPGNKGADVEARTAADNACVFSDQLRSRRNDGSHLKAKYPINDADEVRDLLAGAARHMPALWALM